MVDDRLEADQALEPSAQVRFLRWRRVLAIAPISKLPAAGSVNA
jgi:hypothetical protein